MTIQEELSRKLYDEISNDFKVSNRTRRPDLPEFMTLKYYGKDCRVEFSIGWYHEFQVSYRPQTIGIKYTSTDKSTKEHKTISKSLPIDQENVLDFCISLYEGNGKN